MIRDIVKEKTYLDLFFKYVFNVLSDANIISTHTIYLLSRLKNFFIIVMSRDFIVVRGKTISINK